MPSHRRECAGLIDYACDAVGEGGVLHAVENHRPHRDLPDVALSARLRGDHPRQQIVIAVGGGAGLRDADGRKSL